MYAKISNKGQTICKLLKKFKTLVFSMISTVPYHTLNQEF